MKKSQEFPMFHKKGRNRLKDFREMGSELSDRAREKFQHLREGASDFYEASLRKSNQWRQELEEYIREYPMRSVLIAAGVGLVVAMALEAFRKPGREVRATARREAAGDGEPGSRRRRRRSRREFRARERQD
jgi:ElaB/YqjD/DUF883 family membrane-anchored ribosome-binding protein